MLVFISITTLLISCMLVIIYHKVKRVHLIALKMVEDISAVRQETLILFPQIQALFALERMLDLPKALPAMRGWAGSPDFLLKVAETVLTRKPTNVVECSSGVSTLVIARTLQINGKGHVYSLEHDPQYAAKTRAQLMEYGLQEWATVIDAPLVKTTYPNAWYSITQLPNEVTTIDALIIDGPPSATGPLARYPALPAFIGKLSKNAVILIDDASRNDEKKILERWKLEYPDFQQVDLLCEKGCVMLARGI